MKNRIKIVLLVFVVNSLWAMSRFNPLISQSFSNLRKYVPSNASVLKNRAFSSSENLQQAFQGRTKASGQRVRGYRGGISPRDPGAARKIALLEKKIKQEKTQSAAGSFAAYDAKLKKKLSESLVGSFTSCWPYLNRPLSL